MYASRSFEVRALIDEGYDLAVATLSDDDRSVDAVALALIESPALMLSPGEVQEAVDGTTAVAEDVTLQSHE